LTLPDALAVKPTVDFLAVLVPTAAALYQYMYARIDRWRLTVDRLRLRLANPDMTIASSAEFSVDDGARTFENVNKSLSALGKPVARALSDSPDTTVWVWRENTLRVRLLQVGDPLEGDDVDVVRIDFPAIKRSFRGVETSMRDEVGPFLAELERTITTEHRKYVVTVTFTDRNPYFGLFVTRVNQDLVARFDVTVMERSPTGGDTADVVQIRADHVEIITSTAHAAERLALRYLAVSPVPGRA
jgi:hypothetical protein